MKIHIISNSLNINSGFADVSRHLAVGLKKLGHDVTTSGMQTGYTTHFYHGIECLPIFGTAVDDITRALFNYTENTT